GVRLQPDRASARADRLAADARRRRIARGADGRTGSCRAGVRHRSRARHAASAYLYPRDMWEITGRNGVLIRPHEDEPGLTVRCLPSGARQLLPARPEIRSMVRLRDLCKDQSKGESDGAFTRE